MKLGINIDKMSGHCCKDFQSQRSKVKFIAAEAYILALWGRGLLVFLLCFGRETKEIANDLTCS